MPEVLFTKDSMDTDNPVPVVNIPLVRFIGSPTNKEIKFNMQGDLSWILSSITFRGVVFSVPARHGSGGVGRVAPPSST